MKKISLLLVVLFVVLVFSGTALAANTGVYLGKASADNDSIDNVESFLADFFEPDVQLILVGKSDDKPAGSVTTTSTDKYSGTWTSSSETIYFYTIKAAGGGASGGGFEVYWIKDGALSGDWELNDKTHAMSHISGWTVDGTPPSNTVPIPPSVILFGSGLIGVVGLTRRRKQTV